MSPRAKWDDADALHRRADEGLSVDRSGSFVLLAKNLDCEL